MREKNRAVLVEDVDEDGYLANRCPHGHAPVGRSLDVPDDVDACSTCEHEAQLGRALAVTGTTAESLLEKLVGALDGTGHLIAGNTFDGPACLHCKESEPWHDDDCVVLLAKAWLLKARAREERVAKILRKTGTYVSGNATTLAGEPWKMPDGD